MSKYFNPYTDFGFKKLFSTELNKDQWDITNTMEDSEKKGFFKGKEEGEKLGLEKGLEKGRAEGLEKGRAEGRAEGRVEGLAEGEKKASLENARKMKLKGFSVEDIIDITGLSAEEISEL